MTPFTYEGRDLEAMSFARNYHAWVADLFAPYVRGLVIEVGAGSGNFSSFLLERGAEHLIAIEPSEEMYPKLVERFKENRLVETRKAFFSDLCADYAGTVDTIVYVNVLEHIQNDAEELKLMYAALRPGGTVCVFVPALPWLYSAFDASLGHYRRYRKGQLKKLMEEAGFSIVTISYFDFFGILPWFVYLTLLKGKIGSGNAGVYDRFIVPVARLIESVLPPPVGKNLFVVAHKK